MLTSWKSKEQWLIYTGTRHFSGNFFSLSNEKANNLKINVYLRKNSEQKLYIFKRLDLWCEKFRPHT
jgi:hypothetical protein